MAGSTRSVCTSRELKLKNLKNNLVMIKNYATLENAQLWALHFLYIYSN